MNKTLLTDAALSGLLWLETDTPMPNTTSFVEITIVRSAQSVSVPGSSTSAVIPSDIALKVKVAKDGSASILILSNDVWTQMTNVHVPGPSHVSLVRQDVFKWAVTITSSTDALLSRTILTDLQNTLAFVLDPATFPGIEPLKAEKLAQLSVELLTDTPADLSNTDIRADNSEW